MGIMRHRAEIKIHRPLLLFAKTVIRKIGIRASPNTYIVLNQGSLSPTNCAAISNRSKHWLRTLDSLLENYVIQPLAYVVALGWYCHFENTPKQTASRSCGYNFGRDLAPPITPLDAASVAINVMEYEVGSA
jgi:hypothetical protein